MGATASIVVVEVSSSLFENEELIEKILSPSNDHTLCLYKVNPPPCTKKDYIEESLFFGAHQDVSDFQYEHLLENEQPNYQVVLINDKQKYFSIFRNENQNEAVNLFKELEDVLLPLIDSFTDVLNPVILARLIKLRRSYPKWSMKKVVDYLAIPDFTITEEIEGEVKEMQEYKKPNISYKRQTSLHQHETMEMLEREQPSFARDFFGTSSLNFLYDKHPELISNLISTVDSLVQAGKDIKDSIDNITKYTESPIHVAIRLSQETVLKLLLEKGANPFIPCGHAYPIHLTMKHQSTGCLKLLIEYDIKSVHAKDQKYEGSVLHWAKNTEQIDVLATIPGVDINAVNKDNETALHIMVKRSRLSPAISLICHGADINIQSKGGYTPLHLAVIEGDTDMTRALLFLGANFNIKDDDHKIPKDYIRHIKDTDARDEIKETFELFYYDYFDVEANPEARTQSILKEKTGMESLLTLDGGGIRGLVLVELLIALESITKRPIYDLFDWSSGTSTGSYLSVSVALRRSIRHCQRAYLRLGRSCFVGVRPYGTENVDAFLIDEFGSETLINEIAYPKFIIPAVLVDRRPASLHLFRNYDAPYDEQYQMKDARFPRPPLPSDQLLWLAIRSSCSAPSYFRSSGRYVDGGVIANNPTLDALSEIHKYDKNNDSSSNASDALRSKSKTPKLRVVVSFGTGRPPLQRLRPIDLYRPTSVFDTAEIVDNLKSFIDLMIDQVTACDGHVADRTRSWCEMADISYFRINPQFSKDVELNETNDRILLEMLCDVRKSIKEHMGEIESMAKMLLGQLD